MYHITKSSIPQNITKITNGHIFSQKLQEEGGRVKYPYPELENYISLVSGGGGGEGEVRCLLTTAPNLSTLEEGFS